MGHHRRPAPATLVAGWAGRVTAIAFLGWPLLIDEFTDFEPSIIDFALAAIIGLFLWTGATNAMASARLRGRLPGLVARDLARRTLTVPDDLPLGEAVRRAQAAEAGGIVTVPAAGCRSAWSTRRRCSPHPRTGARGCAVSTVARTLDEGLRLPAAIAGEELILAISRTPAQEYLLMEDDGSIYGVLSTADVDEAFREQPRR